jgi:predicted AlkP superfamily phosphohydrolase/phosphomutase
MKRGIVVVLLAVLVATGVWLLVKPERPLAPAGGLETPPKFLIVGIDSLDWDLVQKLVAQGHMPNIARLAENGTSGMLRSIPPFCSPTIWTSIATGKSEAKHGITGFMADGGREAEESPLASSNMRRAKALWQIFSSADRTAGVIDWLVTYPAEPVNGYMISSRTVLHIPTERFVGETGRAFESMRNGVYPPELWEEVARLRVGEETLSAQATNGLLGAASVPSEKDAVTRFDALRRFLAGDLTVVNLTTHLAASRPTDLTAVYLRGTDLTSHFFWRYKDPDSWGRGRLSPAAIEAFAPVVDRYYEKADAMLGDILKARGENTIVIVCSDHGFAGHRGPPGLEGGVATGMAMHRENGTLVIEGPGIARGKRIEGATVLDITPTVLALSGLPVGRDMDGKPLTEAIVPSFLKAHPVAYIDTYETGEPSGDQEPVKSPVDDEMKEMLRSLGYIK